VVTIERDASKYFVLSKEDALYGYTMLRASRRGTAYCVVSLTGTKIGNKGSIIFGLMKPTQLTVDEYLDMYNAFKALPLTTATISQPERQLILSATRP
jgi:hypothetical protein